MSKYTENIFLLYNNPFSLTPLIISFYKNYKSRENDLLLAYLVLPIVLNPVCTEKLKTIQNRSRLMRLVNDDECMRGFAERFEFYKNMTNDCIQYALDCGYIKITDELSVKVLNKDTLYTDQTFDKAIKVASNLHKMFKTDIINIYRAFGIKKL